MDIASILGGAAYLDASITPTFPSGSNHETVGDYVQKLDVGSPLFTLLQPDMPMDGV
jgi:hypothetical protein